MTAEAQLDESTLKTIYLGLGSNIEPRRAHLAAAVDRLRIAFSGLRASAVYETEPWGYTDQAAFLNMAVQIQSDLAPVALLRVVKNIEVEIGRTPTFRWGPRVIDIDILIYGQEQVALSDLQIPHPRMMERAFVLAPLSDLAPELVVPGTGLSVREAAARCPGMEGVHRKDEVADV